MVLKGTKLAFYKDQKSYRSSPDTLFRGESPIELEGATATVASDYSKRKNVFRLKYDQSNLLLSATISKYCDISAWPMAATISSKRRMTTK